MDFGSQQDEYTIQSRARRLFCPLMFLMTGSIFIQAAGFASPGWFVLKFSETQIRHNGLWYLLDCQNKCIIETYSGDTMMDQNMSYVLEEYKVETCLALASIIIAILVEILNRRSRRPKHHAALTVVILSLISGMLALIAACKAAREATILSKLSDVSAQFPYSAVLTGLGGLLAASAFLINILCGVPFTSESRGSSGHELEAQSSGSSALLLPGPHETEPYRD